ncbi:GNAT family N-acetyltransferase [Tropicibacter alexandrii]|uniref:GNAT family N-acetyltransferase n=1 Tax=Tropicibacter alexandrii TaxID=2267683 RepID=UPI000EF4732E|nr:GNAT family N-acetyltransferase [Tropicibacter alexandrii]
MILLQKGCYTARTAACEADLVAWQALRATCFGTDQPDTDRFDALCEHVLIEDEGGALVGGFRMMKVQHGAAIDQSYSAQFYDLSALRDFAGPMLELGRFCMRPDRPDPDILRLAWGALTRMVDRDGIALLFGCSSFPGADPARHAEALCHLAAHHLAPDRWRPREKAAEIMRFADLPDRRMQKPPVQPPLLRTYLAMGGWVSDHAVIDRALDTVHVFTGVEIGAIPPMRKKLLRALAR